MIETKTNDGQINIAASGSLHEITADACLIIHTIYEKMKSSREEAANEFKRNFTSAVVSGILFDTQIEDASSKKALLITQAIVELLEEVHSGEYDPAAALDRLKGEYDE